MNDRHPQELHQKHVENSCSSFADSLETALCNFLKVKGQVNNLCTDQNSFAQECDLFVSILFIGSVYGEFITGVNKQFAANLVKSSEFGEDISEGDLIDLFKEATNVAVGESLIQLSEHYAKLTLTAPRIYRGSMQLPNYQMVRTDIVYPDGKVTGHCYIDHMELDLAASYNESLSNLSTAYNRISQKSADLKNVEQQKTELERLNQAKSEFLANMSHELRTPLNGMIGMLDLFKKSDLSKSQEEQLNIISRSGDFLLAIINDVLEFSKIESGKLEIEKREFDLRKCVEELAHIMANEAYKKGLELPIYIDPKIPKHTIGDETRIRQVLINLIGNAIKFTPSGEVFLNVYPKDSKHNPEQEMLIGFDVIDTGIGIPEQKTQNIFDSFTQADVSDTRKYGGSGLGLTICKSIVEAMGGHIHVTSREGEGSNFSFEIPFSITSQARKSEISQVATVIRNKKIHETVEKYLHSQGLEVRSFDHLNKAVENLQGASSHPALIIDAMAFLDHTDLSKKNHSPELQDIYKILLCDPHQSAELRAQLEKAESFNGSYLIKPIRWESLIEALTTKPQTSLERSASNTAKPEPLDKGKSASTNVKNVLLVEDNFINQQVTLAMLDLEGISYKVANNGQEAVDLVRSETFDIILMDCQMPIMDGYKATQLIREYEKTQQRYTPIIAMTANAFRSTKERCFECGMDDFVTKPIKTERFLQTLYNVTPQKKAS